MASTDLTMNLIAHDRASATFGKVAGSADHAHSRISRMATLGRMLPVAAITAFGVASVKAFADAEVSQSQLEGAYKRFPKMANENIDSLRSMNSELQRKTKFDDDDLAGMQAKLAMFDLTGQQVADLTPIVADYAQVSGKDVVSAGVAVGRAMMGNTRALKSLGINYKMTGDKAKDAANIQALLAEKTRGAAEEFGKTSAGKLAILNNQFSDLKENVGEALVPALNAMVTAITPIAKIFGDLPAPVRTGAIAVVGLAAAYNFLSPALGGVKGAIGGMARAFGLSTFATEADTTATNANTAAKARNAGVGPGKVASTTSSVGASGAASALAGIPGLAAAAGIALSAFAGKSAREMGGLGGVLAAELIPGLSGIPVAIGAMTADTSKEILNLGSLDRQLAGQFANGGSKVVRDTIAQMARDSNQSIDSLLKKMPELSALINHEADKVKAAQEKLGGAMRQAATGFQLNSTHAIAYGRALASTARQAGKSDAEIRAMLKTAGATPREIKIVMSASPKQVQRDINTAQKSLNGLKQYKRPDIVAKVAGFQTQLRTEQTRLNSLRQSKKPNVDAIDRASGRVRTIQGQINNLTGKSVDIFVNVHGHASAGFSVSGNVSAGATGGHLAGMAVVGERGPELVSLPEGSFVYTHAQSLAMGVEHFARNKPLTAKQKRQKSKAKAKAKAIADARNESYRTESSSIVSFARVTGFDSSDQASAIEDRQAAQREVNMAKGIGERAQALERLAAANKRVAASAPTTANVLSTFRAKLAKINAFGSVLGQLRTKLGKAATTPSGKAILQAVLDEGPENGAMIGQALLSNNGLNQALAIQGSINTQSRWLGLGAADVLSGNYIKPRPAPKKPANKKSTKKYAHITIKMDKRVVHKSLVELKREQGGKALGLA